MEFRLIYNGPLSVGSHAVENKHQIRKYLHPQLLELWRTNAFLRGFIEGRTPRPFPSGPPVSVMYAMAERFKRCGYRFLPLIKNSFGVTCSLDILFLRRGEPGKLVQGGDIDNRIKVLFDALKMPQDCAELGKAEPAEGEDPFMCLLEDDRLITEFRVLTDRLLTPPDTEELRGVSLIIHVKTLVTDGENGAWPIFGHDR